MKFLSRHFAENGKEKLFPNDSLFLNNVKNAKQILSWQSKFNKFFETYLLARSNVSHFSTKKESVIILKMTTFWRKNIPIFHNLNNRDIFLLQHVCFLYLLTRKFFFQKYIEIELKVFFITSEGFFESQK